jgi:hypothetical protein
LPADIFAKPPVDPLAIGIEGTVLELDQDWFELSSRGLLFYCDSKFYWYLSCRILCIHCRLSISLGNYLFCLLWNILYSSFSVVSCVIIGLGGGGRQPMFYSCLPRYYFSSFILFRSIFWFPFVFQVALLQLLSHRDCFLNFWNVEIALKIWS